MSLIPSRDYFTNNVALRNDTILGVCEALGHDLGFNPNFLRIPLGAGIIFAPLAMVGIYLALGAMVFVSRTFFPDRVQQVAEPAGEANEAAAANEQVELARAA
ncbi:phage shock protein PspC (stress-responsive transcriptional regulator) [Sphingomonas kaistensis]|uniref:Phage shock protein PspC (Stress-responsive transcriptional regulator) n=1 Tax=Sphingomonas kaistensis TaxID=298708 RepID=A0A7X6BHT4_9SPHN|nr:PspC domain-containing protein [Sphingomonas kaistensis]NJC06860.1 phage shock protein PspC (stress-responsive transcriptional regulator) [Sphingomonas kaistensis]